MVKKIALMVGLTAMLGGCMTTGDAYRSDVYTAYEVNQAQEVRPVQIIAVLPARVYVANSSADRATAQTAGAILGAIIGVALGNHGHDRAGTRMLGGIVGGVAGSALAGSGASGGSLVDGVQITFRYGDKLLQSTQVGQVCEYKPGTAVMVSPAPNVARIQPNNAGGCVRVNGAQ